MELLIIPLVLILVFVGIGFLWFSPDLRVNLLLWRGKHRRARKTLEYLLERNPERAGLYRQLGEIYYLENRRDRKAIKVFEIIIRLKLPFSYRDEILPLVAHHYIEQERKDSEALRLIEKAVSKELKRQNLQDLKYGDVQLPRGAAPTERYRDLAFMLMALGDAYLEKSLFNEAVKKYTMLLRLNVTTQELYVNLSKAYIGLKKFDRHSMHIFQRAIQYDPQNTELYNILAASFLKQRRTDDYAVQIYEMAVRQEDTPVFERLSEHLAGIYFKKMDFVKCKEVSQRLLQRQGYQPRSFSLFFQSCWKTGLFDDAIEQVKQLLASPNGHRSLLKFLCLAYLEKKFLAELQNKHVAYGPVDRQFILEYVNKNLRFQRLQDLSLYIDLRTLLAQQELWGGGAAVAHLPARTYTVESLHHQEDEPAVARSEAGGGNVMGEVLGRLTSFEDLSGRSLASHSKLTYEDFKKSGPAIFYEGDKGGTVWDLPEDAEVVITMELSNYDELLTRFGAEHVQQIRQKLYVILGDLLEQYRLTHIWGTANGLLAFTNDVHNAAAFAVDILNKLNRYNFMTDSQEEMHLTIGVHHARERLGATPVQTLKDLSVGLKLGILRDRDVVAREREIYGRLFQKSDRIFLSGKAYRQLKSSNRFQVHSVGQFNLRYFREPMGLHEIIWRNPLDDLRFGHIKKLGRFDLLAEISGEGIFKAYKAKDAVLQRFVIVKVVQSEVFNALPPTNRLKVDFYKLAKSHGQLSHENVANIYEVDEDHGLTYIAREFSEGVPVTQAFGDDRPLNADRLVQIIYQICKGLQHCHNLGFCHLNLKPSNVLVGPNDETKLLDLYIPTEFFEDYDQVVQDHQRLYYLAPEQVDGKLGDHRSDIFALGILLYHAVTHMHPFATGGFREVTEAIKHKNPPMPSELNRRLPKFFESLILRCMSKAPDGRFQSAQQIISLLKKTFDKALFSKFNFHIAQARDTY